MESSIMRNASRFLHEQKKKRKWQKVLACLALVVAAGTTIALIMPGQALNNTEKVLDCQIEVHQHTADCYGEDGTTLICGLADYVAHTHNELCYNEEGELICKLPEIEGHVHTDECYAEERVLTCGLEETFVDAADGENAAAPEEMGTPDGEEGSPVSGGDTESAVNSLLAPAVQLGHVHTDECYTTVRKLICGKLETVEHVHTDACFKEVTVDGEEEATDETLTNEEFTDVSPGDLSALEDEWYFCGQKAHAHSEECYDEEGNLVCGLEEHGHTEDCLKEVVYGCGLEAHTHSYSCYDSEDNLICGMQEHEHDEECIIRYWCGYVTHTHNDACYAGVDVTSGDSAAALNCGLEEHEHTDECLIAPILERVYEDDSIRVTATYPASAMIPEDAEFRVVQITEESDPEHYGERSEEAQGVIEGYRLIPMVLLNIGFFDEEGVEIQPERPVEINLQFLDEDGVEVGVPIVMVHFTESGAEVLDSTLIDETGSTTFVTDGFSDFYGGVPIADNPVMPIASGVDTDFVYNKYIDYLGDGVGNNDTTVDDKNKPSTGLEDMYRLYLDMEGKSSGIDLLFVIDRSASMCGDGKNSGYATNNTVRSDLQVYNLLYGGNGHSSMIQDFLNANAENKVGVVWYAGKYEAAGTNRWPTNNNEGGVIQTWTHDYVHKDFNSIRSVAQYNHTTGYDKAGLGAYGQQGITNYVAGYFRADMMLKQVKSDGKKKVVIFLSDGLPTVYYNYLNVKATGGNNRNTWDWDQFENGTANVQWLKYGSGAEDSITSNLTGYIYNNEKMFDQFVTRNPDINFYAVGFRMEGTNGYVSRKVVLEYMAKKYDKTGNNLFGVSDQAALKKALETIMFPKNVKIKDQLSDYVDLYWTQPDVKVTAKPKSGGSEIVLWTGNEKNLNSIKGSSETHKFLGSYGSQKLNGVSAKDIVDYVDYNGSTGTIRLYFKKDYCLNSAYTYTLSFNVRLTDKAFDEYSANSADGKGNAYKGTKGDANTDIKDNNTSSRQPGFFSNKSAKVFYEVDGNEGELKYDNPVVQPWKSILVVKKIEDGKEKKPVTTAQFQLMRDGTPVPPSDKTHPGKRKNFYCPNSAGELAYYNLQTGNYTLTEIIPEGYVGAGTKKSITFKVERGRITSPDTTAFDKTELSHQVLADGTHAHEMKGVHENWKYTLTITNKREQIPLIVKKVDKDGNILKGAEFTLYKKGSGGEYREAATGVVSADSTDGLVTWTSGYKEGEPTKYLLEPGKEYCLKETKAPANYTLPEEPYVYFKVVSDEKSVTVEKDGESNLWYEDPVGEKDSDGKIISWKITIKNSSPNIKLNLVKLNTIGKPLADAKFGLYKSGKQLFIGVSEVNNGIGSIKWSDSDATDEYTIDASTGYPTLTASESENDYCLKEEESPAGYKILNELKEGIHFTVTQGSDGKLFVTNSSVDGKYVLAFNEAEVTLTVTVWNTPEDVAVHILKSGDGKELSDAVFRLEKLSADGSFSIVLESKSNEKGIVDLGKLEFGVHYRLEEIQGPPGYNKFDGMIYFTVIADPETGYAKVELENGSYSSDVSVTGESGPNAVYEITVVNYLGAVLPETGGNGIYLYMLSGLAVAVLSMIALMYKNKFGRAGH